MEQLWNEDDHMDLVNLRIIDVSCCKNLRKIPNLSRAINLEILICSFCISLVQFWKEDNHMDLVNLRRIDVSCCKNLRNIPNLSRAINLEILNCSYCKSLVQLWKEDNHTVCAFKLS
ncbi:hypothetical protein ES332_A10G280700v1 [Gossypium tomentosum]|uniref:Uncharacterized protein n=1 Tax=Gossypium tomentosum TaxID=34277 RepID=A0A5D2NXK6_GOSTO|nr:hypothetical protein ES332_A10G280700v1 [Gossypium tomentosum]